MIINFKNMSGNGGNTGIGEAPIDGKQYARQDATWTEVQASAEPPIEVVVPTFNFRVDPITIRQDITPEDKTANIAASEAIKAKINAGESPNVVLRQPKNRFTPPYFTPWKVMIYKDVVQIIALQDSFRGNNEIVGYAIQADGSIQAYTDWKGADERNLKTINGTSLIGKGDITITGGGGIAKIKAVFRVPNFNTDGTIAVNVTPEQATLNAEAYKIVETNFKSNKDNMDVILLDYKEFYPIYPISVNFYGGVELVYYQTSGQQMAVSLKIGADGNVVTSRGPVKVKPLFDEVPADGQSYARTNDRGKGSWVQSVEEAPADGLTYARNNNSWVPVSGGGSSEEFIYANNPLTEKEKSHNKAAFASGNKIATICNRMSGLDTMCAVIYQYNYNGDYVYDCMYQHTEFLIGYNPSTGDMTSISYNTFYTGTISYNPYYVNVPLYMADGSEVTPLTEDEKHLNSAKIKEMLNYLPPINGHQYSDNIFLAIREIIPIEEVQGLFPLASQYMHNVQTRFTNLHYENGLFTFDDMTFQYTTYIDGKEYEVSSKMLMDGSITLVSLNESVTKKYVDDLVGAANNKLETI